MPDFPSVVDLGAITRPQQVQVVPAVLAMKLDNNPGQFVDAQMLVSAIADAVRKIVREELNAAVAQASE